MSDTHTTGYERTHTPHVCTWRTNVAEFLRYIFRLLESWRGRRCPPGRGLQIFRVNSNFLLQNSKFLCHTVKFLANLMMKHVFWQLFGKYAFRFDCFAEFYHKLTKVSECVQHEFSGCILHVGCNQNPSSPWFVRITDINQYSKLYTFFDHGIKKDLPWEINVS